MRSSVALPGAIALVAPGRVAAPAAWDAVDVTTIALLPGLIVVSARFRLGGFSGAATARLASWAVAPGLLLGTLIGLAGLLSADGDGPGEAASIDRPRGRPMAATRRCGAGAPSSWDSPTRPMRRSFAARPAA